jgi:hypothetical protein
MQLLPPYSRRAGKGFVGRILMLLLLLMIWFMPASAAARSLADQPELKDLFALAGRMHNIDPDLLEAMAEVESGGDPLAISPKGALGLMQLMPATASGFSVLDPFNPVANVIGAANLLDYLRHRLARNLDLQGLPDLLAAYNAGAHAVEKYHGIPPYTETHSYVRRVLARYANQLSAESSAVPVLILGPKPYLIRLRPGSSAVQAEPVLIDADNTDSGLNQNRVIRDARGHFVAVVGTGTASWIHRSPIDHAPDALLYQVHR